MNILETSLACSLSFLAGLMLAFTLYRRKMETSEAAQIGKQLMSAINDARQDVLNAYKLIDTMEAVNISLKRENFALKTDNEILQDTATQLRIQLNKAMEEIERLAGITKENFKVPSDERLGTDSSHS